MLATTTFVPEVETDPAWHVRRPELDLDFARYEIREGDIAIGLRLGLTVEFPAGENDGRTLYLFRQDGTRLVEILHAQVQKYEGAGVEVDVSHGRTGRAAHRPPAGRCQPWFGSLREHERARSG